MNTIYLFLWKLIANYEEICHWEMKKRKEKNRTAENKNSPFEALFGLGIYKHQSACAHKAKPGTLESEGCRHGKNRQSALQQGLI